MAAPKLAKNKVSAKQFVGSLRDYQSFEPEEGVDY